jgi:hypothetical protein
VTYRTDSVWLTGCNQVTCRMTATGTWHVIPEMQLTMRQLIGPRGHCITIADICIVVVLAKCSRRRCKWLTTV